MSVGNPLPILYVEGKDDISVINALMCRHGIDTKRGAQYLQIKDMESVELLLENMPEAIRNATDRPIGFVVDIDIELTHRWDAVRGRLQQIGIAADPKCPPDGFFDKLPDYPHGFGVWLMPDCKTDGQMLEHLIQSLMPAQDPLWPHAQSSTQAAAMLIDTANATISGNSRKLKRFSDTLRIKAEVRSWLAWQSEPGVQLGAAINDHILGHDSPQALAFVGWLKQLYGFTPSTKS